MKRSAALRFALVAWLGLAASAVHAQSTVALSGSLGANKALLIIDGSPRTVSVGSSVQGVRLISLSGDEAVVEVNGRRLPLRLGASQVSLGGKSEENASGRIVLSASSGGHFITAGTLNGQAVQFLVDTGASLVSIGQDEAERLSLRYREGTKGTVSTANGSVMAYKVSLHSVRINGVQVHNVDAVVLPNSMPYILLGNSFLSRFQLRRDNDILTLDRRF